MDSWDAGQILLKIDFDGDEPDSLQVGMLDRLPEYALGLCSCKTSTKVLILQNTCGRTSNTGLENVRA